MNAEIEQHKCYACNKEAITYDVEASESCKFRLCEDCLANILDSAQEAFEQACMNTSREPRIEVVSTAHLKEPLNTDIYTKSTKNKLLMAKCEM